MVQLHNNSDNKISSVISYSYGLCPLPLQNLLVYMNTNLAFLKTNLPDPAFIM